MAVAGALLAALAVTCAVLAPLGLPHVGLRLQHPDARALSDAGWRWPFWRWEAIRAVCVLAGATLALLAGLPLVVAALAVGLAPSVVARARAHEAARRARLSTTRLMRTTEAALRSGAALPEALRRATDASSDPLARRPFSEALRRFDLGAPLDETLRMSAAGVADARTRLALETLAIGVGSRLSSGRAGALLSAAGDRLAFAERLDEEVRARTSGLRAQVVLLAAIVPCMAAYLAITVPSLGATLSAPVGRTLLVPAALILEVVGLAASRRAVNGPLR